MTSNFYGRKPNHAWMSPTHQTGQERKKITLHWHVLQEALFPSTGSRIHMMLTVQYEGKLSKVSEGKLSTYHAVWASALRLSQVAFCIQHMSDKIKKEPDLPFTRHVGSLCGNPRGGTKAFLNIFLLSLSNVCAITRLGTLASGASK